MLLIDADIVCYRVGFAANDDPVEYALRSVDSLIQDILIRFPELPYRCYLTGKDNFRDLIAVTAPYKGNRDRTKGRPVHYDAIRQHLVDAWDAVVIDNMEADDAIAIDHDPYVSIICSIDKDFDQLPGLHYNFVKGKEYTVTEEDARQFLYEQIITGDTADNIIGIRGIGPVKAKKLLADCKTEHEMYMACVKAYEDDGAQYPVMRVVENAQLLYLLRSKGDKWTVPQEVSDAIT